jgi:hypothetical protein
MAKISNCTLVIILVCIGYGLFGQCDLRGELQKNYTSQIGIRELTGNNDGPEVEAIIESAGFDAASKIPWCAATVYYNYLLIGHRLEVKYPALSAAYFDSTHIIYQRGEGYKCDPQKGDLIGIYFKSKGRIAHIGFYDSQTENYFISVEGNTNKAGSREGDGIYRKYRPKGSVYAISSWL